MFDVILDLHAAREAVKDGDIGRATSVVEASMEYHRGDEELEALLVQFAERWGIR